MILFCVFADDDFEEAESACSSNAANALAQLGLWNLKSNGECWFASVGFIGFDALTLF